MAMPPAPPWPPWPCSTGKKCRVFPNFCRVSLENVAGPLAAASAGRDPTALHLRALLGQELASTHQLRLA